MVNGENRAKLKEGATAITRGMKRVTIGVAEKIQTCIDTAVVQPTMRAVDFGSEHNQKDLMKSDAHFHAKVKKAQAGNKFMKVVFAQPVQSGLFEAQKYPKSEEDIALIDAALDDNFVFSKLPASKRTGLIEAFEPIMVKAGTKIIEEGEEGDYFYVVGSGVVDIQIDGKDVGTAEAGSSFGELALLYQAPRAATCIAKTMCGLFRLDQETFKRTMAHQVRESQADVMGVLKSVPYFKDLGDKYLHKISSTLRVINYKSGDFLVSREEDTPRRFYILKSGHALIQGIQLGGSFYNQIALGPNEFFGEIAMLTDHWSCESVVAKGDVVALVLDREQFMHILGDDFASISKLTLDKKALVSKRIRLSRAHVLFTFCTTQMLNLPHTLYRLIFHLGRGRIL
jgi:cAMP-dependent protein kinase regulator